MKYIFSNQVIDFTMLFLMIWNVWVFIFNKSQKEDMKMAVKNIPMYIRILFIFCINVLMGAAILIDIGIIDYSNKFLIMTSAIWGGMAMVSFGSIYVEKKPIRNCKLL